MKWNFIHWPYYWIVCNSEFRTLSIANSAYRIIWIDSNLFYHWTACDATTTTCYAYNFFSNNKICKSIEEIEKQRWTNQLINSREREKSIWKHQKLLHSIAVVLHYTEMCSLFGYKWVFRGKSDAWLMISLCCFANSLQYIASLCISIIFWESKQFQYSVDDGA